METVLVGSEMKEEEADNLHSSSATLGNEMGGIGSRRLEVEDAGSSGTDLRVARSASIKDASETAANSLINKWVDLTGHAGTGTTVEKGPTTTNRQVPVGHRRIKLQAHPMSYTIPPLSLHGMDTPPPPAKLLSKQHQHAWLCTLHHTSSASTSSSRLLPTTTLAIETRWIDYRGSGT